MILLVDNYDSFVHNLARYFRRLGLDTNVVRNDQITPGDIGDEVRAIVFSPGPCTPREAGNSLLIAREFFSRKPLLGVCLGHQTIAAAFGAQLVRAAQPMHGRTSRMSHSGEGVFAGLANPLCVARYHSLVVDEKTLPDELRATAWAQDDGALMAFQHRELPIVGLQFHPESILTDQGFELIRAFLMRAGIAPTGPLPDPSCEYRGRQTHLPAWPDRPVTF